MKLRILNGQLPASWSSANISEICTRVTSGGTPSRKRPDFYGGKIGWVKTKELLDGWLELTEETITKEGLESSSAKLLPEKTVLMAMYGATVGQLGILRKQLTCNQAACALVVNPELAHYRYVYYQLLHARTQIVDSAVGAAQQNLSARSIKEFELPLPPLEEQRGIAATLGALDDKIDSNRQVVSLATRMTNSLYRRSPSRERVRASDLLKPVLGGTPKRAVSEYWGGTIPWASAKDIAARDGSYVVRTEETITPSGVQNSATKVLPGETVVMTARGTVGALALLPSPMAFNQSCYGLTPRGDVSSRVLFLGLREAVERIKGAGHGSVFNTVNMATFDQIELDWPVLSRQATDQIERYFDLILQKLQESQKLEALRDALLPELLSGRIRVPEAAEAVGSA